MKKQLHRLKTKVPLLRVPSMNVVLTGPALTAEIGYRSWTNDGKLRHQSFKGACAIRMMCRRSTGCRIRLRTR
ncbi:hypothetical protein [Rhizobium johnstonii]|uniref:hypothetical protein n=1 Tax=Rhizobium johnstonii TaxID=3019933 RepID=UPI003F978317